MFLYFENYSYSCVRISNSANLNGQISIKMKSLKHIYKASQCSDIDDVNAAIQQVKELIEKGQEGVNIYRRLNSLYRLRDKFQEKARNH